MKRFIAPVIAVVAGIAFIVMGIVSINQVKSFPQIEAVVKSVEIDAATDSDGSTTESVTVYVTYTVDGKEYNELLQEASSDLKEGDKITVRYNPKKPDYVTATTKGGGVFRLVFGIVILLAGLAGFLRTLMRGR